MQFTYICSPVKDLLPRDLPPRDLPPRDLPPRDLPPSIVTFRPRKRGCATGVEVLSPIRAAARESSWILCAYVPCTHSLLRAGNGNNILQVRKKTLRKGRPF